MRACFKRSSESPATNMQQPTLGMSHLILGDSLVRELQILRISWISNRMVFGVATIAQLYRMVETSCAADRSNTESPSGRTFYTDSNNTRKTGKIDDLIPLP